MWAKNRREFVDLCMQGLDLISNRSMGLPRLYLDFSRLILGFWNKIQERYNVVMPRKVLVNQKLRIN